MNKNNRMKDAQSAQGMVEFALVLPILLLIILGVFAFGHLFFVYSSVVSASREASRWGAAVGEASTGGMPRYQDCAAIRSAAVRIGAFAGVGASSVDINYDEGPTTTAYAACPLAGTGPSGTVVHGGDRIVVRVTVNYKPIVPLVNLPSFPITAETARTIVKNVPVGDAPVAEDPGVVIPGGCVTQTSIVVDPVPESVTGEPVIFSATVSAVNGTVPTGMISYTDLDGNSRVPVPLVNGEASFPAVAFQSAEQKTATVTYTPDTGNVCHVASTVEYSHKVNKAATTLALSGPNNASMVGNPVVLTFQLAVTAPGAATTSGPAGETLTINVPGGSCTALTGALTSNCTFTPTEIGTTNVIVGYTGSANYTASPSVTVVHVVTLQTLSFVFDHDPYPAVNVNTPVLVTVIITLPSGGVIPIGDTITISAPNGGSCSPKIDSSLRVSCTLTPTVATTSLPITASYNVSTTYDYASYQRSTTMRVNAVEAPPFCPYFASDVLSFPASTQFYVDVKNRNFYDMEISKVKVSWPTTGETVRLSEIRFAASGAAANGCQNKNDNDCIWVKDNDPALLNTEPLVIDSSISKGEWISGNPGIAKDATKRFLMEFSLNLPANGSYMLELEFVDKQGNNRCTTSPIINYTR